MLFKRLESQLAQQELIGTAKSLLPQFSGPLRPVMPGAFDTSSEASIQSRSVRSTNISKISDWKERALC